MGSQGGSTLRVGRKYHIKLSLTEQYVIIDQEHGNHDDGDMHESVNAVASAGASPIVRIRAADYGLIKRALDCGAQ